MDKDVFVRLEEHLTKPFDSPSQCYHLVGILALSNALIGFGLHPNPLWATGLSLFDRIGEGLGIALAQDLKRSGTQRGFSRPL